MKIGLLFGVLIILVRPVNAGEIILQRGTDNNVIQFSGPVEIGDLIEFENVSSDVPDATVLLSSPGGILHEGLRIGDVIRSKGYKTKVVSGSVCASACGFMWLAGRERVVEGDGRIGFHAAYKGGSDYTVSASGNAVAGAYMARLGLNDLLVIYATEAAPREMRWLTPGDAKFIGLEVSWLSPSEAPSIPYVLTRAEIEEAAQSVPELFALKQRFPTVYSQIIEVMHEAQGAGENWEKVALDAILKLPNLSTEIYSTAPDNELVEAARIELSYLKYLEKNDPVVCASTIFPEFFSLDRLEYFARMPAQIRAAKNTNTHKMLSGPVLSRRPLTKSDRQYVKRKMKVLVSKTTRRFSAKEQNRIADLEKNRDAKLACKLGIVTSEAILLDTRLVMLLSRYPSAF